VCAIPSSPFSAFSGIRSQGEPSAATSCGNLENGSNQPKSVVFEMRKAIKSNKISERRMLAIGWKTMNLLSFMNVEPCSMGHNERVPAELQTYLSHLGEI
jgi:hypothetical protein